MCTNDLFIKTIRIENGLRFYQKHLFSAQRDPGEQKIEKMKQ